MVARHQTISFLSDYGTADEFVGVVKSVIRAIAPHALVIDVSHEVPAHDVRAGGLTLARAAQYLAPGVVLAVVDPGVGTDRRPVAIEVGDGESVLVGPDNGLLAPAVAMVGGATRAVQLAEAAYRLPAPGPTFDGRDVFAPAAAHLCTGVPLDDLGPEIDTASLRPGIMALSRPEGDGIAAEVLWVDRFGNAQLNVDPDDLAGYGERVELRAGSGPVRSARRARTYADIGPGEVGLVVDSYGLVAIVLDRRSAADELGLGAGDPVTLLGTSDDGDADAGGLPATGSTPVRLGARRGPS
jgi:S-adenosylmethionine hydrolase